jgi:hypothetical protein
MTAFEQQQDQDGTAVFILFCPHANKILAKLPDNLKTFCRHGLCYIL